MSSEFIDINLLPPSFWNLKKSDHIASWRRKAPSILLFILAFILVMAGYLLLLNNNQQIASQKNKIEITKKRMIEFSALMAEVEILQEEINTLATQSKQLEEDSKRLKIENSHLAELFRATTKALLPRMSLTSINTQAVPNLTNNNATEKQLIVQGQAGSRSLVFSYIEQLEAQPEISKVKIRSIEQLKGDVLPGTVKWILEIKENPKTNP